jgi:hypothetical protein
VPRRLMLHCLLLLACSSTPGAAGTVGDKQPHGCRPGSDDCGPSSPTSPWSCTSAHSCCNGTGSDCGFRAIIYDGGRPAVPSPCASDDECASTQYCDLTNGACCPVGYDCNQCVVGDTISQTCVDGGITGGCPTGFGCVGVVGSSSTRCECSASQSVPSRLCGQGSWRCELRDACGPSVDQGCCPLSEDIDGGVFEELPCTDVTLPLNLP